MFARFIGTTALVLSTIAVSSAAHAEDTATVRIVAATLATEAGHKAAIHRIERAARNACDQGRSLSDIIASRKCAKELSAVMVEKLASAELALQTGHGDNTKLASR